MMNPEAKLTKRESQIAELIAWGLCKKEVANQLFISERTVENHARNIYEKIGCGKVNELSAWWFCTNFKISFDLSPLKRSILSVVFLVILTPKITASDEDVVRVLRTKTASTRTGRTSRRRNEADEDMIDFTQEA